MDPSDPEWLKAGEADAEPSDPSLAELKDLMTKLGDERPAEMFVDFAEKEPVLHAHDEDGLTPRQLTWLILQPFIFTFFLTALFLGMRGIMDLGGFVAKGGPYEIAHPAPPWWWVIPVSMIACIVMVVFSFTASIKGESSLVVLLFWPAIFISLGWNFLEYGFLKGDLMWGWIICGIVFIPMGAFPLFMAFRNARSRGVSLMEKSPPRLLVPQVIAIAVAIPLGILFFNAVS